MTDLPLIRLTLIGPASTRAAGTSGSAQKTSYRRALERAVVASTHRREAPTSGPLAVRILVTRRPGRRGDVDNIAKPILDALQDVFGVDGQGRADDHRVRRLEVHIQESQSGLEFITIEVFQAEGAAHAVA